LHVAGWTWAVFTRVYLESCISLSLQSGNFWIHPRTRTLTVSGGCGLWCIAHKHYNSLFFYVDGLRRADEAALFAVHQAILAVLLFSLGRLMHHAAQRALVTSV
jgi:hypothetical protein